MKLRFKAPLLLMFFATLTACGALGGPSDSEIEALAKQAMAQQLESPELSAEQKQALQDALAGASVTKKGICNNSKKDIYACMVDVSVEMPGAAEATKQTLVIEITKGADGQWKTVE